MTFQYDKSIKGCEHSEDSERPVHPRSLIRAFAEHSVCSNELKLEDTY